MKTLWMMAIALATLQATAQDRPTEIRKADVKERMAERQDLTPEELATLRTKKLTLQLDLTEAQQAEVHKLMLEEANLRKEHIATFKARQATDEKPTKDDRFKRQNARLDHQIAMKRKMKAILNADQYAKFENMHTRNEGKRNGMKRGKAKAMQHKSLDKKGS